ncbi:hypothetical protein D5S17_16305 [Pseudonocardiaceae bacterium YIM PH 21723]|nr:hypothetical protein D5S17_16305 [Pseudonocardiaceae bacterium YIM PH 21723]
MVVAVLASLVGAPAVAMAEDQPSEQELLRACNSRKVFCQFHPTERITYSGEYKASGRGSNCSNSTVTRTVEWSNTRGTVDSVGVSISAELGMGQAFALSVSVSYGHEWHWSETKTDRVAVELAPGQGAEVWTAPLLTKVTGDYELHFPKPFHGHYIWYVSDVSVEGPAPENVWDVRVENYAPDCAAESAAA